ncbi:MAG: four helix bundle protein, partial [Opitutales bacterium]|nr:four helix bundle protein [Opitutales bacterium]
MEFWKDAKKLVGIVYSLTKKFPESETFALTSQLRRAVISIPSNIAEGNGRQ